MTNEQAWIAVGVAAAVVGFFYLATKREIHATVTAGEATITYRSDPGAAAAPTAQEDSHAKMLRLIERSERAIQEYDVGEVD